MCALFTLGVLDCPGPYPCDVVAQASCTFILNCTSPVGCNTHCSGIMDPRSQPLTLNSTLLCGAPGGSCSCSTGGCQQWDECKPGKTCNGDPCATISCFGREIVYNSTSGTCGCQCRSDQKRASDGGCYLFGNADCPSLCQHGECHQGKCWCNLGYSGEGCSQRDSCVTLAKANATSCPNECPFCIDGTCFITVRSKSLLNIPLVCPLGWACVFVCDDESCSHEPLDLVCPLGTGPCELWCWGVSALLLPFGVSWPGEFRPYSKCTRHRLICEDPVVGCQARCGMYTETTSRSPYYQARTVRAIISNGTSIESASLTPLGSCSVGTDSCYIGETDTCYKEGAFSGALNFYGYVRTCPLDRVGQWLKPYVNETTNTCECACGAGYEFVNGSCSALGCFPKCQNLGVCQVVANNTHQNSTAFACKCFAGWSGKDCTSRCFFPITANVTFCANGYYIIDGKLVIPGNRSLDLYRELPDLQRIDVHGDVTFGGFNSTLSIAIRNLSSIVVSPSVNVSGNWVQSGGSTLQSAVVFDPSTGTFVVTTLNINGILQLTDASFELAFNAADIIEFLKKSSNSSLEMSLMTFSNRTGEFANFRFDDGGSSAGCEKLVKTAQYTTAGNGKGSLIVLFGLDRSGCDANKGSGDDMTSGTNTATIAVAVIVPVVAIGIAAGFTVWQRKRLAKAIQAASSKLKQGNQVAQKNLSTIAPLHAEQTASKTGWSSGRKDLAAVKNVEMQGI
jgi:hypothetical protein